MILKLLIIVELPPNWELVWSEMGWYYFNAVTSQSTWELPVEVPTKQTEMKQEEIKESSKPAAFRPAAWKSSGPAARRQSIIGLKNIEGPTTVEEKHNEQPVNFFFISQN